MTASDDMNLWRGALIAAGVVLLMLGGAAFLTDVQPEQYPGVAAWLAGAVILHDGIVSMGVFGATVAIRRLDRRVPFAVLAIIQAAAVVALIVTAVVLPEIVKQQIGSANPSVLPLDYAGNLILVHAVIAGAAVGAIVVVLVSGAGRRRVRPEQPREPGLRRRFRDRAGVVERVDIAQNRKRRHVQSREVQALPLPLPRVGP